jgi:hypothetical protein
MYSIFRVHRTEGQWLQQHGRIVFSWAIVNPNGPTLSCIGLRYGASSDQVEVFCRSTKQR